MTLLLPFLFVAYSIYTIFVTKIPFKLVLQRFGICLPLTNNKEKVIWIHSVSSGEINASLSLINLLIEKTDYCIYLSTSTPTGYYTANKIKNKNLNIFYKPIDHLLFIYILLNKLNPSMLILTECELWPNTLLLSGKKFIKIYQINGIIEDKAYNNYTKFKFFVKNILNQFNLICVQNENEKNKYISLGANAEKVKITGNTKYDYFNSYHSNKLKNELTKNIRQDIEINEDDIVILFASTHQGEEQLLINLYKDLNEKYDKLKLLIAPRFPDKKRYIIKNLEENNLKYTLRSKGQKYTEDIYIIDTIGELMDFISISDIIVMGGSFLKEIGGHNILEPAFYSKPIIVGPYNHSFQDIFTDFKENNALIQTNENNLKNDLERLIVNKEIRISYGNKARELINKGIGASEKTFNLILNS